MLAASLKNIHTAYTGALLICQTVVVLKIGFWAFLRASARIAASFHMTIATTRRPFYKTLFATGAKPALFIGYLHCQIRIHEFIRNVWGMIGLRRCLISVLLC